MCDPCFMDANQVGYVHELTIDEVKQLLDDAITIKPRRQMTVQFSGGEPTISPIFLDAVRYARQVGYFSVQAATNGIRFAQDPDFAREARDGGHADRVPAVRRRQRRGQRASQGRQPVRREAARDREPPRRRHRRLPGRDDRQHHQQRSGRTDRQVRARRTATRSASSRSSRCRSPGATRRSATTNVMPSAIRCRISRTTSSAQTGATEPLRDWFPLSASGAFSDVTDLLQGPGADWGIAEVRLPSRLRHRHGLHGQQEDQGVGAAFRVPQHRPLLQDAQVDRGRRARAAPDQSADRAQPAAQLLRRAGARPGSA